MIEFIIRNTHFVEHIIVFIEQKEIIDTSAFNTLASLLLSSYREYLFTLPCGR